MIARKKRSRFVAFPTELVVDDGEKKSRCFLFASGVNVAQLDPQLKDIIQKRKASRQTTVDKAREVSTANRTKGRHQLQKDLRSTKIVEIKSQQSLGTFDHKLDKAIYDAFHEGSFGRLLAEVKVGKDPNTPRLDGATGLMAACLHGNLTMAHELLQLGADPDVKNDNGSSSRDFAAAYPDKVVSARLLDLLSQYEFVYDIYVTDADDTTAMNQEEAFSVDLSTMVCYDDGTGRFVEYAHNEDDDFGKFGDEDSDSNDPDFYERHMYDEGDDDYMSDQDDDYI